MAATLRLTVITGPHRGQRFCFRGPVRCKIGRAPDCFVQLSGTERDQTISRYHCELAVNGPNIRIRDLGSQNGTFINGHEVPCDPEEYERRAGRCDLECPGAAFGDGDILTIGGTSFQLDMVDCPPKSTDHAATGWETGEMAKKGCPVAC